VVPLVPVATVQEATVLLLLSTAVPSVSVTPLALASGSSSSINFTPSGAVSVRVLFPAASAPATFSSIVNFDTSSPSPFVRPMVTQGSVVSALTVTSALTTLAITRSLVLIPWFLPPIFAVRSVPSATSDSTLRYGLHAMLAGLSLLVVVTSHVATVWLFV